MRSRDKRKTYLRYNNAYGHKTWEDDLPSVASTHKVT